MFWVLTAVNLLLPHPVLWTYYVQSADEGRQMHMTWFLFLDIFNKVVGKNN